MKDASQPCLRIMHNTRSATESEVSMKQHQVSLAPQGYESLES
jgi:amino acid transporter